LLYFFNAKSLIGKFKQITEQESQQRQQVQLLQEQQQHQQEQLQREQQQHQQEQLQREQQLLQELVQQKVASTASNR
jgi:hypothetical protein